MKSHCTLGITEEKVICAGGILPFLYKNGVKVIDELVESQCINVSLGQEKRNTKYGLIRNYTKYQYDTKNLKNLNLKDYLLDKKLNGIPTNGSPRKLIVSYGGYTFELAKKKNNLYRVSSINNTSVLNSFTREEIVKIKDSVPFFDMTCTIQKKFAQNWDFTCTPDK